MKIQICGYYETKWFNISLIGADDEFPHQRDVSEAEMWEVISYLLYHPHYVVTQYQRGDHAVKFQCIYDQSAKARQIAESNRHFERMSHEP